MRRIPCLARGLPLLQIQGPAQGSARRHPARLKGVPHFYFTIDRDTGWESAYPTRELMMNYQGKAAIALWRHQVEMVGCACI
jgi:hypothetical protein